jgi:hypothetical protein
VSDQPGRGRWVLKGADRGDEEGKKGSAWPVNLDVGSTIWIKLKIYAMMLPKRLKRYMTMPANKTFRFSIH